ncbi:MAG TPA: phenylalanine--tRNA ligase subunit alpha, partial [Thermoplasmata archaeon]|nr:phenylalanine--tRNA ligase subunit alpha [Thermoplasmata archaeon]
MPSDDIVSQLSFFEKKVLKALHKLGKGSPEAILKESGLSQLVEVMNASSWLQAKGLVSIDETIQRTYTLKEPSVTKMPLPERIAIEELAKRPGGKGSMADLIKTGRLTRDDISISLGWVKKKGWGNITKEGKDTIITLTERGREALSVKGQDELVIEKMAQGPRSETDIPKEILDHLRSRKDILNERLITSRTIALTPEGKRIASLDFEIKEEVAQLTPELIQTGKWRNIDVRKYDVKAFAPALYGGRLHPMTLLIEKVRSTFLLMGFKEITGGFVESAFWNMDALFTAQDHPAREMQDTFYIKDPERLDLSKYDDIVEIVKQIHENGWKTGSLGWRYNWSRKEAE